MATPNPVYVGDDWPLGPFTLVGANGQALNLTGCTVEGLFFSYGQAAPLATLSTGDGSIALAADLTSGVVTSVKVPHSVSANVTPQDRCAKVFPTRTAIVVTDAQGNETTRLLILYLPLDRRTDVPPSA